MACDAASRGRWRAISALLFALVLVQADSQSPRVALERFADDRVAPIARELAQNPVLGFHSAGRDIEFGAQSWLLAASQALQSATSFGKAIIARARPGDPEVGGRDERDTGHDPLEP